MLRRFGAVSLAVVLILSACSSDDGSGEPSSTDAPASTIVGDTAGSAVSEGTDEVSGPAQDVEADRASSEAALLTLDDFPAGWSEVPADDGDEDDELSRLIQECLGVADGEAPFDDEAAASTGDFTNPEEDQLINHAVTLLATTEDAEAYMAGASGDGVTECLQAAFRERFEVLIEEDDSGDFDDAELGEITVGALNVGAVGDETFAYRITIPLSIQGFSIDIVSDQVAVRVGRSLAGLQFQSQFSPVPIETVTEYASLAASRPPAD